MNLASTSDIIDYQTAVFDANVAESGSASSFLSTYKSGYYYPLFQLYLDRENGMVSNSEVETTLNQWRNNDYYKEYRDNAWRAAVTQRYNMTVSQKVGDSNHFLSFNYENDKGLSLIHILNIDFEQAELYHIRLNFWANRDARLEEALELLNKLEKVRVDYQDETVSYTHLKVQKMW